MRVQRWSALWAASLAALAGCGNPAPPPPATPAAPVAPAAAQPTPASPGAAATTAASDADADAQLVDAKWGGIRGQVVLEGAIPQLADLIAAGAANAKDAAVCAKVAVPDETLVVDPVTNGIANVVVYLRKKPEQVHPSLATSAASTVLYDQIGCRFVPHVIVARTDQAVNVVSADAVAHNTRGTPIKNQGFNFLLAPVDRVGQNVLFKSAESLPIEIRCDIHPWMKGYWMVVDHPYAAVTAADGTFSIPKLPPGEHEFRVWHEGRGYIDKSLRVTVTPGQVTKVKVIAVSAEQLLGK